MQDKIFLNPNGGQFVMSDAVRISGGAPNILTIIGLVLAGITLILVCCNLVLAVKLRKDHERLEKRLDQIRYQMEDKD